MSMSAVRRLTELIAQVINIGVHEKQFIKKEISVGILVTHIIVIYCGFIS